MTEQLGRRRFLKLAGISAGTVGAAAAFSQPGKLFSAAETPEISTGRNSILQTETADEMDKLHEEGVKAFLANVGKEPDFWRKPLEPVMDGDVKVFNIVCQDITWETSPGMSYPAMAYNGMIPGPEIRFTEGDKVRFVVKNEMAQSTAIHFHGVRLPNDQDGVPFITQPVIKTGETHSYEFTARNAGTHMYHSHHNAAEQVTSGLLGTLVIEPKDKSKEPKVDAEYTFVLNDTTLGFTINGRQFPNTQPIVAEKGQKIRVRYVNEGLMIHPMHLHGITQTVITKDGNYLPAPYVVDTLLVGPGERYDVVIDADEPGVWAYHCHVLTHAESRHGMFGMVTVLIVK
jgi:FtsP/CotA-like multicopper oxidase with cupredoxin domain